MAILKTSKYDDLSKYDDRPIEKTTREAARTLNLPVSPNMTANECMLTQAKILKELADRLTLLEQR